MNLLSRRPSSPEAAALRARVFNVLPAASLGMEKLFGLLDIVVSDATSTAAVECRSTPRPIFPLRRMPAVSTSVRRIDAPSGLASSVIGRMKLATAPDVTVKAHRPGATFCPPASTRGALRRAYSVPVKP